VNNFAIRWPFVPGLAAVLAACGGGGGGGGAPVRAPPAPVPDPDPVYEIAFIADPAVAAGTCMAPLFAPGGLMPPILATTVDLLDHQNDTGFWDDEAPLVAFPRHLADGGPTLEMDTGVELTDDIRFEIGTNAAEQYVSVQLKGQPLIGVESLSHESEVIELAQSVTPLETQPFTVHVDTSEPVPIWELDDHLGGNRVQIVGYFCLNDLEFTPVD